MSKKDKLTNTKTYNGYNINNGNIIQLSSHTTTLDQVQDQVEYTSCYHSKAINVRVDIRNQKDCTDKIIDRKAMTRIMEHTKRILYSKYKNGKNDLDLKYVCTTENEGMDGINPHHHLLISANGNAIQNGRAISQALNKAVQHYLNTNNEGLVEFCKSNGKYGKMVDRNSPDFAKQLQEAVYAGIYLAKKKIKAEQAERSSYIFCFKITKRLEK